MNKICRKLKQKYKFKYDINAILSDLIYARILEPCSKRSSYKVASEFLEKPSYELHDVYRALDVLGFESIREYNHMGERAYIVSQSIKNGKRRNFLALTIYRFLEKKLGSKYTCEKSLDTLKEMNFAEIQEQGFTPLYKREAITDGLHDVCGFRTDYQFITKSKMRNIQKKAKEKNKLL